jgi:hypothetical protein
MTLRYGRKFWLDIVPFIGLLSVLDRGEELFRRPAEVLAFRDEYHPGLLEPNLDEFQKLHTHFLKDALPKTGGESKFFL